MVIEVIINRASIGSISNANLKSGTTALLSAGAQKILFDTAYTDADYNLPAPSVVDATGIPVGYTLGALEADGFNITLSFDSIVSYIANKTS